MKKTINRVSKLKLINLYEHINIIMRAGKYACQGLHHCYKYERALRQEINACIILIPFAVILSNTLSEFVLLTVSLLFVLIVELLNTSMEKTLDRVSTEINELTRIAKDCGAAAVMLSLIITGIIWLSIIIPWIIQHLLKK